MENITKSKDLENRMNKHIMFSYSHKQEGIVKYIYELIDEEFPNIKKWIDYNNMDGNILDSMTNAIEESFLVIVFLSKSYKNSKNCKIESELIIGKKKRIILVLLENDFPYCENTEKKELNWLYKSYKNQFYLDMVQMNIENTRKMKELVNNNIEEFFRIENKSFRHRRKNSLNSLSSSNSFNMRNSPKRTPPIKGKNDYKDFDDFVLDNSLNKEDIETIKDLIVKTPRTMVPTLKAGGLDFKSIISLIDEVKNEEEEEEEYTVR